MFLKYAEYSTVASLVNTRDVFQFFQNDDMSKLPFVLQFVSNHQQPSPPLRRWPNLATSSGTLWRLLPLLQLRLRLHLNPALFAFRPATPVILLHHGCVQHSARPQPATTLAGKSRSSPLTQHPKRRSSSCRLSLANHLSIAFPLQSRRLRRGGGPLRLEEVRGRGLLGLLPQELTVTSTALPSSSASHPTRSSTKSVSILYTFTY